MALTADSFHCSIASYAAADSTRTAARAACASASSKLHVATTTPALAADAHPPAAARLSPFCLHVLFL